MTEGSRPSGGPAMVVLRGIARVIVTIAVVLYTLLDQLFFPVFRPLFRYLGSLQLFQKLGALIGRLPPYLVLVLLGVPFVLIEPLKLVAVWWAAVGHPIQGLILLIISEIVSLLVVDRIFHAGYAPLMRIGWFRVLFTWLIGLRDWALNWAKSTGAWQWGAGIVGGVREWFRRLIASVRRPG